MSNKRFRKKLETLQKIISEMETPKFVWAGNEPWTFPAFVL
jgi:hypothetical protein